MNKLLLILFALLLAGPAWSAEFQGSCAISFTGTSTLHDFDGSVPCQPFALEVPESGLAQGGKVSVAVAQMDTDNDARDKKLREMFDSGQYPLIVGHYPGFSFADAVREALAAQEPDYLDFTLRIRDIEHPVHAALRNFKKSPQELSFDLQFDLSLAAFQLRPPSVLGLIRVGDTVSVKVDVHLQQPQTSPGVTAQ